MFSPKTILLILLLFTTVNCSDGQKLVIAKRPPTTQKPLGDSRDIVDGKTVIDEVMFTGLDGDFINYEDDVVRQVPLSDLLRKLRENKTTIETNDKFDSGKVEATIKVTKEYLADLGYMDAKVIALGEKLPKEKIKLIFSVERGSLMGISQFLFTGTRNFTNEELAEVLTTCLGDDWRIYDRRKIEYCTNQNVRRYMFSKGFFKAKINDVTRRFKDGSIEIVVDVEEGRVHRLGRISVKEATVFSEKEILEMFGYRPGDVADGSILLDFAYETLPKVYRDKGYVQFNDEFEPEYIEPKDIQSDPIVNIKFTLDEGHKFKLAGIEFVGISKEEGRGLKEDFPLKEGEDYNQSKIYDWFKKLNETGKYDYVDADQDVEIRTDEKRSNIDLVVKISKPKP